LSDFVNIYYLIW